MDSKKYCKWTTISTFTPVSLSRVCYLRRAANALKSSQFHTALILLHRPFVAYGESQVGNEARGPENDRMSHFTMLSRTICVDNAKHITMVFRKYRFVPSSSISHILIHLSSLSYMRTTLTLIHLENDLIYHKSSFHQCNMPGQQLLLSWLRS